MSMTKNINLYSKFDKFTDNWSPKVIAELNDYQFKLIKIKGEFATDEVFILIEGRLSIEFETETIKFKSGKIIEVPKGVTHNPFADVECKVILLEPRSVLNTDDVKSDMNVTNEQMTNGFKKCFKFIKKSYCF